MPNEIERVLGESEQAARARLLTRVRQYVEIETPSRDESAIKRLAALIAADLRAAGAAVEITDAPGYGAHVIANVEGDRAAPHIVVLAHMDTVHASGTILSQPFAVLDGRAEGPGIYDMKIGFTLAIEALNLLKRQGKRPTRPVRIVLTCDEEIGSHSSLPIIEANVQGAAAVLVPEPCIADGKAKTERKGVLTYRMTITGRAAHAGTAPTTGVSAIVELGKQLENIYAIARPEIGTTVNVGVVSGGTASNVVAANATAEIDVRVVNVEEGKRVHHDLISLNAITPGATVTVQQTEQRPPLERTDRVVELYHKVRALAAELGRDMGEGSSGGGSDGSFTAAMGIPTLDGLGADGGGAHAADEHILTAELPYRLALFARIFQSL